MKLDSFFKKQHPAQTWVWISTILSSISRAWHNLIPFYGYYYVMLHTINGLLRSTVLLPKVAIIHLTSISLWLSVNKTCFVFLCNYTVWVSVGLDLFWFCGCSPCTVTSGLLCYCVVRLFSVQCTHSTVDICISGRLEGEPCHLHVRAEEPAGLWADYTRSRSAHSLWPA